MTGVKREMKNQDGKPVLRTRLSIPVELTDYFFFFPAFLAFFFAATALTSDQLFVFGSVFSGKLACHCAGTIALYVKAAWAGKCFF
jgi:hypothetical protein